MIYLPQSPLGLAMLSAYLSAEPDRRTIYEQICSRLGPAGLLNEFARYWVCQRPQRRAVLRGVLLCIHELLPSWTKDDAAAEADNRAFIAQHREAYNAFQSEARAGAKAEASVAV